MAYTNPSIAEYKTYFYRDFPFGTDPEDNVTDADVAKAFTMANCFGINQELFDDQGCYTTGYMLLSAHFMVLNLRSSSQGINGKWSWLEQSKSVGSVSQSFAIPQRILDNPAWAALMSTNYGAQLMGLLLPQLVAPGFVVCGSTRP